MRREQPWRVGRNRTPIPLTYVLADDTFVTFMVRATIFALGFTAGWLARGSNDSPRAAALTIIATVISAADRLKRAIAIERDRIEDLIAEARARADVLRDEREPPPRPRRAGPPPDEAAA